MKTYRHLLFDLDDTLLDFGAAEKVAMHRLVESYGLTLTPALEARYKAINDQLWRAFERGEVGREDVLHGRHARFFGELGHELDGAEADRHYRGHLEEGHQLVEGALDLLEDLHERFELYVVSNGVSRTQHRRLHGSGLLPLFKGIFVSEDTGYQKPMKGYFDYVFARIPGFAVANALIIGDSLSADITGGHHARVDTCWFNPAGKPNDLGIEPTYQIGRLDELHRVLNTGRAARL